MRMMTARHFGAAKKAVRALGEYYNGVPNDLSLSVATRRMLMSSALSLDLRHR